MLEVRVDMIGKSLARYAAVQFIYQIDVLGDSSQLSLDRFVELYIKPEEQFKSLNLRFFYKLVTHFFDQVDFGEIIQENLGDGKSIENAPLINISIIKVAISEMIFEKTAVPVIINEYIEIAKKFSDTKSVKFINALLDKISKKIERKCLIKV
jgi:N utilization substance protein B